MTTLIIESSRRLATATTVAVADGEPTGSRMRRLMDPFLLTVWVVRLLFLALLYVFLFRIARALVGDLRAAAREPGAELGRLVVVARRRASRRRARRSRSTRSRRSAATSTTRSSSRTSSSSAEHAILTFRGRAWYVEDLGSTNGTFVNGVPVEGVAPLGFGDELQLGQVRLRLERPRRPVTRR